MILLLSGLALAAELQGTVRSHGAGDPVEGAWVRADAAPGAPQALTGLDGRFVLDLPAGEWALTVGGPEHALQQLVVVLPEAGPPEPITVYLRVSPPEEVVVESRRPTAHVAQVVLDRERVEETPGTYEDPIRLVQSMPGVTQTREYSPAAGDISLRGAAPGESRFYVDGVEVPYLYHFQQYASVIHTRLLDEVAVYPSTFGPAYGDAVGGVVAAETRPADTRVLHGGINAGLIMAGAYVTAPLGGGAAVTASARRSYLDLVESGNDQYTLWPAFWDYLARYDQDFGADHHLSLTTLGAGDRYARYVGDTASLDPLEQAENPTFDLDRSYHGAVARARDRFARASVDTVLAFVSDRWVGRLVDQGQDRRQQDLTLRTDAVFFESDDYQLSAGLELKGRRVDLSADPSRAWFELEAEAPLLARGLAVDEAASRLQGGVWLEPRVHLGEVVLRPGARLQGDTATEKVAIDPRLTVLVALSEDLRLRAGLGRYTQAPSLDDLSPTIGDPELKLTRSDQAALGVDLTVAGRLELSLDGWARTFRDAIAREAGLAPRAVDGSAWGVELASRYRLRERFFFGAWASAGQARREDAPFDYDQPYALSLLSSWDFAQGWNAGLRYRLAAGLPYTPILGGVYDGTTDTYQPSFGETNSERLPAYQKVDGHLERRWSFRRWTLVAYAELWWVPPGANVLYPAWSYDYSEMALVGGPPFLPLVGMRADL